MGSTLVEKVFSSRCGTDVRAGEVVMAPVDATMIHDITGPLAIQTFRKMGGERVFDPSRVVMLFDHQVPADSIAAAENQVFMRRFAAEQGILNYDIREGVCHQVVLEKGHAAPGEIVIGSDSHTCMYGAAGAFATGVGSTDMGFALRFGALYFRVPETVRAITTGAFPERVGPKDLILSIVGDIGADGATYRAVEFGGEAVSSMGMAGRMTLCNMAIEMGAKAGIVPPDATTWDYIRARRPGATPFELASDPDADVRRDAGLRRLGPRTTGRRPSQRRQRGPDLEGRGHARGPGLHRLLHERPVRGSGRGRRGARRPYVLGRSPGDRDPGLAGRVPEGAPRRA